MSDHLTNELIEAAAKRGYDQCMKNLDRMYPRPDVTIFPWEQELEELREDWRLIAKAILCQSEYSETGSANK